MNSFEPLPFSCVLLGSPVYMDGAERRTLGGVIHDSVMPYGRRPDFDFDLSGMKLVAFVISLTSAAVFVVLIVALVIMTHTSLLTTHTALLMKLAYMDVAAVHTASLSFIAAVLFGIGDAYKSMH